MATLGALPVAVVAAQAKCWAAAAAATAFVPPVCFDAECAAGADAAFLTAVSLPLVAALAVGAWVLRPPPKELLDSGRLFEDPKTGTMFEAPEGVSPEVDKNDLLAFKPISYTPWPVASDAPGERVRVGVGKVGATEPRTFVFEKLLPGPSQIVCVTLPRPLGVVFEFDERRKRASVAGFVEGSNAEQRQKVARLNKVKEAEAALEGDVLRAFTCTCPVWPTKALFGAVAPERHLVVYGADKGKWGAIRTALRRGTYRDGPVTLVLERRVVEP
ncbi:hypothetical protein MNEG_7727 [Monoraphidium neglectum]|uniref:Uncharacterized protein n=1 Tax=Monoraphidium neglectum TaxID=145388 RepID=A0A0D2MAD3_9CHLO|nr:hypothetical protein MNEG_7727 [Monoraphidium neglectum]KIZ00235.1 hypothetical protein MNEG_7727 [Monoraphidium neglectum]|eukprot:XP_013899254.1 hypothetical protein MNEG_7727 [Monoraphidium neglectum]